jgi:LysM domain
MPPTISPARTQSLAAVALASASLVVAAAMGSIFLNTVLGAWAAVQAAGPAGPADGILLITGLGGTLLALWLGLAICLTALSTLPGAVGHVCRELAARVAPAVVCKVVAFVLGTTLTAALVPGTAVAGIGHGALPVAVVTNAQQATSLRGGLAAAAPDASFRLVSERPLTGGRTVTTTRTLLTALSDVPDAAPPPTWSLGRAEHTRSLERTEHTRSLGRAEHTGAPVVVLRGDTLWSIASRHLGPGASATDIDTEWRSWFAANLDVIGEDAGRILPGQRLRPPPSPHASKGAGS